MIPILYEKNVTNFTTNGFGRLSEALSCNVVEKLNGQYELTMEYPTYGKLFNYILNDRIIYARTEDDTDQPFRIYKVGKSIGGKVKINASHISEQLSFIPVSFISTANMNASTAVSKVQAAMLDKTSPFKLSTNIPRTAKFGVEKPVSVRNVIGGQEGSLIDVYKGEVYWDKFNVNILDKRERSRGFSVRYGKNLTSLSQEENIQNTYTSICGYYHKDNSTSQSTASSILNVQGNILLSPNYNKFAFKRTMIYDVTSEFDQTVISGYRVGQAFYGNSEHTQSVTVATNNYYIDQETIINIYFNPANDSSGFSDSEHKHPITPDSYKYYVDQETNITGYLINNNFYKDREGKEILVRHGNRYYIDQTEVATPTGETKPSQIVYMWNGSNYYRVGDESTLAVQKTHKATYTWNGYKFVYLTTATDVNATFKNYVWRWNGSRYEIVTGSYPTVADVDRFAKAYMDKNNFGVPKVSMKVSFVNLIDSTDYKNQGRESVHLGDRVSVIFQKLGINTTTRVTAVDYDVLNNRHNSITLGDESDTVSKTVASQNNEISKQEAFYSTDMKDAINRATEMITGGLGGYIKIMRDKDGNPEELLVMDESDYRKAQNVIRFNKNGIGFSVNGYNGPFHSAWTIDGNFNANWITTGLLTAITMQTAASGYRVVINGGSSAVKGMLNGENINIIDMVNGNNPASPMVIDAKTLLAIRAPQIGVVNASYGTGGGPVTNTYTGAYPVVSGVRKNMSQDETKEVWVRNAGHDEGSVYCTLPVFLDVDYNYFDYINGFMVNPSSNSYTTVI